MLVAGGKPVVAQTEGGGAVANSKESFDGERQWKTLFQEAKKAYSEKRYREAKTLLVKASAIKPTPKVLANLAQTEIELGEYVSAATHANQALVGLGKNPAVQADLVKAKEQIGTVVLFVNTEGVEVAVDGTVIGTSPITSPLFLEPGSHKVVASKVGYTSQERSLTVMKGAEERVEIQLVKEGETPTKVDPVKAPTVETVPPKTIVVPFDDSRRTVDNGPNPYILVGGGVVTVGALVTGFVMNAKANRRFDAAKDSNLPLNYCVPTTAANRSNCDSIKSDYEKGDRFKNTATVAFITAGAAAIGTVTYLMWPRKYTSNTGSLHVEPVFTRSSSEVWLSGNF
jgi:hypothetical protein